jgi:hypothetical protein
MSHVFHFMVERHRRIPTWQDFKQHAESPEFRHMLWDPAQQAVRSCVETSGVTPMLARNAVQWRIGNFYYSMLREQWVHAYLRRRGVPALQHLLADALFAVDGWVGDEVIALYVSNRRYRSAGGGRKRSASTYLGGSSSSFTFKDLDLPPATRFGVMNLPSSTKLDAYIAEIRRRGSDDPDGP